MNKISLRISPIANIKIIIVKNQKFLLLNKNNFSYSLFLPSSINFWLENSFLFFSSQDFFSPFFLNGLKEINAFLLNTPQKRILLLKGLGLKVKKIKKNLEFKLGFSHKSLINKKSEIKFRLFKKKLAFVSYNKAILGNLIFLVKKQKLPDNYKGKGIWYKNEKKKLKTIKKK
jgi:hypothetical protein